MSPIEKKRYLGDGVYSEFDGHQIKLTTSNGHDSYAANVIFLEPEVVNNLLDYIKWVTSYRNLKIEPEFKSEEYKIEYPVVTSDYIKDAIERNFGGEK